MKKYYVVSLFLVFTICFALTVYEAVICHTNYAVVFGMFAIVNYLNFLEVNK
jgi:hypothetical protein